MTKNLQRDEIPQLGDFRPFLFEILLKNAFCEFLECASFRKVFLSCNLCRPIVGGPCKIPAQSQERPLQNTQGHPRKALFTKFPRKCQKGRNPKNQGFRPFSIMPRQISPVRVSRPSGSHSIHPPHPPIPSAAYPMHPAALPSGDVPQRQGRKSPDSVQCP